MEELKEIVERLRKEANSLREYIDNLNKEIVDLTFIPRFAAKDYYKVKYIKPASLRFKGDVFTTHACPIGQKCTGWGTPLINEIGWGGRIQICTDKSKGLDKVCENVLLHSGTGGYNGGEKQGEYRCSYDLTIFLKDFPKMYDKYINFCKSELTKSIIPLLNSKDNNDIIFAEGLLENMIKEEIMDVADIFIYDPTTYKYGQKTFSELISPYLIYENKRYSWLTNRYNSFRWESRDPDLKYGSGWY